MVDRDVSSELDIDLDRDNAWKKDDNDKKSCPWIRQLQVGYKFFCNVPQSKHSRFPTSPAPIHIAKCPWLRQMYHARLWEVVSDLSCQNGRNVENEILTKSQSPNQPVCARPVAFNNQ